MWTRLKARPLDLYILYRALALTWAFVPVQVFYLQARGLTFSAIVDLNTVFSLAAVSLEVPTGVLADRRGRRLTMALSGVVMVVAMALFVLGTSFAWFALANVFCALSMTLASGADSAYLYDYLAARRETALYPRYEGLATAAKGVGNLAAILLGSAIYAFAPRGVFVFTGVLTATAAIVALALPEQHPTVRDGSVLEDLARASRTLVDDSRLLLAFAFGAITFVLLRIPLFADQPHLEAHLADITPSELALAAGLLFAAKEIGGAILASSSGALLERNGARIVVPGLAAFFIVAYAVMGRGIGVVDIIVMIVLSSAMGLFSPLMRALLNQLIPGSRDRATLLSFESMGRRLLGAVAIPLFGRAVESSSLHAAFTGTAWTALGCYALLGLVTLLAVLPRRSGTIAARAPVATTATA